MGERKPQFKTLDLVVQTSIILQEKNKTCL